MSKEKTLFENLYGINVNDKTETKEGLTYLSWAWAFAEFKKNCPDFTYEVKKFENGLPYVYDENTGYMVFTSVTVDGLTQEMWLPVMDSHNKAMLNKPYNVKTKYKEITVPAATMFDINKAIMRCLVKNLAVFGLGLYIYAGEDLPEMDDVDDETKRAEIKKLIQETGTDTIKFLLAMSKKYKKELKSVDEMQGKELDYGLARLNEKRKEMKK